MIPIVLKRPWTFRSMNAVASSQSWSNQNINRFFYFLENWSVCWFGGVLLCVLEQATRSKVGGWRWCPNKINHLVIPRSAGFFFWLLSSLCCSVRSVNQPLASQQPATAKNRIRRERKGKERKGGKEERRKGGKEEGKGRKMADWLFFLEFFNESTSDFFLVLLGSCLAPRSHI